MIKIGEKYVGTLHSNKAGSGYFKADDIPKDLYIYNGNRLGALHLDLVEIEVIKGTGRNIEAKVIKVIERFRTNFVGAIEITKEGNGIVLPISNKMSNNIIIKVKDLNGAKDGQKVLVKIGDWSNNYKILYGKVIEIIGNPGDNEAEINAIIREYDLPHKFEEDVKDEANAISSTITSEEIANRTNFISTPTFTIDPESARDFDDAISLKMLPSGDYEVGVHIADVSYYVRPGSELDKEAYKRGTSVYLIDRVVPMLPEELSNDICSLRPKELKLTFSVLMTIDRIGKVKKTTFTKGVIKSNQRFTYEEAEEIIQNSSTELPDNLTKYALDIKALDHIASMLREDRLYNGSIVINRDEYQFDLDEKSKPVSISVKKHLKSQELVEEFMLLANKAVAEFVNKKGLPFVNRVHEKPDAEKLSELKKYFKTFDLQIKIGKETKSSLNKIVESVEGKPIERMVNTLISKTMKKAFYTTNNQGHYGLGFEDYSHFTSPIRRYSDLIVHRLLNIYVRGKMKVNLAKLEGQCGHLSTCERKAKKAERDSIKYKQMEFMVDKISYIYDGVITSITNNVIFIELLGTGIEGLVLIENLPGKYKVNDQKYFIENKESGIKSAIGDSVIVKVMSVNINDRRIEFEIV